MNNKSKPKLLKQLPTQLKDILRFVPNRNLIFLQIKFLTLSFEVNGIDIKT